MTISRQLVVSQLLGKEPPSRWYYQGWEFPVCWWFPDFWVLNHHSSAVHRDENFQSIGSFLTFGQWPTFLGLPCSNSQYALFKHLNRRKPLWLVINNQSIIYWFRLKTDKQRRLGWSDIYLIASWENTYPRNIYVIICVQCRLFSQ